MISSKLPQELVGIILEYTGWLQEDFKRCTPGLLATYENNRGWFHKHQSPTFFALRFISQHAWWTIPVCATQLDANHEQIVNDYHNLSATISRSNLHENFRVDSFNPSLPRSQKYSTLGSYALKTYYLVQDGVPNTANLAACPTVATLLQHLPLCRCRLGSAAFYVLARGTVVPSTFGLTNCTLQVHLPLDVELESSVERAARSSCDGGVRVGNETRRYEFGRSVCFDDSFVHTISAGKSKRGATALVLLVLDLWHPDLFTLGLIPYLSNMFYPTNRDIFYLHRAPVMKLALQGRVTSNEGTMIDEKRVFCSRTMTHKIVLLGDTGTGKSSLLRLCSGNHSILNDRFHYSFLGFEISRCTVRGIPISSVLYEHNEPSMFDSPPMAQFQSADCLLIMFDVTRRSTYEHAIGDHLNRVVQLADLVTSYHDPGDAIVVLLGTHIDCRDEDREVSSSEVWSHIRSLEPPHIAGYFEVCTRVGAEVSPETANVRRTKIGTAAVCSALDDMLNAVTRHALNCMSEEKAKRKFDIVPNEKKSDARKCAIM